MTNDRCTRCGNRIRARSRRCRHCGQRQAGTAEAAGGSRRWGFAIALALSVILLLVIGQRHLDRAALADWYADFALQTLPVQFSNFAPAESPTGAFYFCVRRVVKDVTESQSIETFPAESAENTVALGDGRYRVESYVEEDRVNGERVKRHFTCTTRYRAGRWLLEDLTLGQYSVLD